MRTTSKIVCVLSGCAALAVAAWFAFPASPETLPVVPAADTAAVPPPAGARTPLVAARLETVAAPASAERVAQDPAIRGRLIDATTGLPLAGRTVELRQRTSLLAAFGAARDRERIPLNLTPRAWAPVQLGEFQLVRDRAVMSEQISRFLFAQLAARAEAEGTAPEAPEPVQFEDPLEVREHAPEVEPSDAPPETEGEGVTVFAIGSSAPAEPASGAPGEIGPGQFVVQDLVQSLRAEVLQLQVHGVQADVGEVPPGGDRTAFRLLASRLAFQHSATDLQPAVPLPLDGRVNLIDIRDRMQAIGGEVFAFTGAWPGVSAPPLVATATTDAEGRFRFDCPEAEDVYLELVPGDHDWIEDTRYTFVHPETRCSEPIEWRVDVSGGSRVRGVVLDAKTRAPLGGLTLELRGERDQTETVTSDDEGRFASSAIFAAGHLSYTVHDGAEERRIAVEPGEARVEPAGNAELELRAAIGPTWRFRFVREALQDGGSKRILVLQEHDSDGMEVRLVACEPWPGWEGTGNPFAEWRGVTEGPPAWVRYPVAPRIPRGGPRAEFRSSDGAWAGSAVLTDAADGQEIVVARTARVEGQVELREGESASGWRVRACRAGGGAGAEYDFALCDEEGRFTLEGLDTRVVRALEVRSGEELVLRIELALEPEESREIVVRR